MKKQYTTPSLEPIALGAATIIATSIPVKGDSDTEARSRDFWGGSIFDDDTKDDDADITAI